MKRSKFRAIGIGLVAAFGALCTGCGGEREFTAQEIVEEIRGEGVGITLGQPLIAGDETQELYSVELEPVVALEGAADEHGTRPSGSLSVSSDAEGAEEEMASCRGSADLLCYRAANVVIVIESDGIEAQRLAAAMQRLAEE